MRVKRPQAKPKTEWSTGYKQPQSTWIGQVFAEDEEEGKRQLVRVLKRHRGYVKYAARDLGITRRWVFYMLWTYNLWPALDAIRAERKKGNKPDPEWLVTARAALAAKRSSGHDS